MTAASIYSSCPIIRVEMGGLFCLFLSPSMTFLDFPPSRNLLSPVAPTLLSHSLGGPSSEAGLCGGAVQHHTGSSSPHMCSDTCQLWAVPGR